MRPMRQKIARGAEARAELERRREAGELVGPWDIANAYLKADPEPQAQDKIDADNARWLEEQLAAMDAEAAAGAQPQAAEPISDEKWLDEQLAAMDREEAAAATGAEARAEAPAEPGAQPVAEAEAGQVVPAEPEPEAQPEPEEIQPMAEVAPVRAGEQPGTEPEVQAPGAEVEADAPPEPQPQPEEIRPVSTDGQWRLDDYARREAEAKPEPEVKAAAPEPEAGGAGAQPAAEPELTEPEPVTPVTEPSRKTEPGHKPEAVPAPEVEVKTDSGPELEPIPQTENFADGREGGRLRQKSPGRGTIRASPNLRRHQWPSVRRKALLPNRSGRPRPKPDRSLRHPKSAGHPLRRGLSLRPRFRPIRSGHLRPSRPSQSQHPSRWPRPTSRNSTTRRPPKTARPATGLSRSIANGLWSTPAATCTRRYGPTSTR